MSSEWYRYVDIWAKHSIFYSFTFTLTSTLYQAYAIRVLGFDVSDLGNTVFISLAAIALGNFVAVPLLYRYRRKRVNIWKIFTTINIISWALIGFSDLLPRYTLPIFLAIAQFAGAIGGLAYSDTIADLIPKEKSIAVFSRVNVYTVTASLLSLITTLAIFTSLGSTLNSYRVCYTVSLISALVSSILLWMMKDLTTKPNQVISLKTLFNTYEDVTQDGKCRDYIISIVSFTFYVNLPGALWNYYIIKVFNGNELWISIKAIASTFAVALGNYVLNNVSHKLNPKKTIEYSAVFISLVPILFILSPTLERQVLMEIYSGLSWAGFNLMTNIYNLYLVGENRIYLVSMLGILNNLGASIASRVGSAIASLGLIAMQSVFVVSWLGRLAVYFYMKKRLPSI
ncbi:MAG: permease [Ignisphaera sp.]|uniref:Permease n=1 Tax=Ignisphaera aggregans TaxID=334771 RepID=A0A7C4NRZ1_9CREN